MSDRQLIADLLSALEYHTEQTRPIEFSKVAIEAAREYLSKPAQPQQEPVVRLTVPESHTGLITSTMSGADKLPPGEYVCYTSPPASKPWVGLTVAEIEELTLLVGRMDYTRMIQLAEAKLKEKNA